MDGMQPQPNLNPQLGLNSLCNYHIERKIGKGQFSEVYRATYILENKLVALKKVKVCLIGVYIYVQPRAGVANFLSLCAKID